MKNRTFLLDAAGVVLFFAVLAGVTAWASCAGPSPWLRPQGELVQLERQAAGAKALATDGRTRAALDLCITSAQAGVHAIDALLGEQEKLRQAKKQGAAIPELERAVARATTDADDAESQARTDCRRAGVTASAVRAPAPDGAADGGAAVPTGLYNRIVAKRNEKMLAAKLYELEIQKRNAEKDAVEATKSDIGWGSQIRNYVLDQSRIKDLRTGIERSDTQKVLDGDLDEFVEASLKAGLAVGSKRVDA